MHFRIQGLRPEPFQELFGLSDAELAARNAKRVFADKKPGFPCRVSLKDAEPGELLILTNFVSQEAPTPYRTAHAIYIREAARESACFVDALPPVLKGRPLSLRGFDGDGMLSEAVLALPGEAEAKIRELFDRPEIAAIHAHNAAHGCFAAKIERT